MNVNWDDSGAPGVFVIDSCSCKCAVTMSEASSFSSAPVALSPSHREAPDILVYERRSWRSIPPMNHLAEEELRCRKEYLTLGKKYEDAGGRSSRYFWRCDLCSHDTVVLLSKMMPGQVTVRDRLGFGRRALLSISSPCQSSSVCLSRFSCRLLSRFAATSLPISVVSTQHFVYHSQPQNYVAYCTTSSGLCR